MLLFNPSSFHPLILSIPTSACTIVSDHTCTQVSSIMCDDVPPSAVCEVHLMRTFPVPGTYCVNITLEDSRSLTVTTTTVTINKSQDAPGRSHKDIYYILYPTHVHNLLAETDWCSLSVPVVPKTSHTAGVVLASTAVLVAAFAFIAYLACKWVVLKVCASTFTQNVQVSHFSLFYPFNPFSPSSPLHRRYKVYRPIRRSLVEDARGPAGVGGRMVRLKEALFPSNEESHHLLTERRPLQAW